jgi:hypothetical protein
MKFSATTKKNQTNKQNQKPKKTKQHNQQKMMIFLAPFP